MSDLRLAMATALNGYALSRAGIHGPRHWLRVLCNGRELASRTSGADLVVIELFAIFHDSRRVSDRRDRDHGRRAAEMVTRLARAGRLELDTGQVALLTRACAEHELGRVTTDPTVGCCWDSDRLELSRLGRPPIQELLSTAAARNPDVQAAAWARGTSGAVDPDLAASLGLELTA